MVVVRSDGVDVHAGNPFCYLTKLKNGLSSIFGTASIIIEGRPRGRPPLASGR